MTEKASVLVRRIRDALGMTQAQFGEAIHRTEKTVRRWEQGKTQPKWDDIQAVLALEKKRLKK
jgi:DNA-binding transcriptional regulator YiaG